MRVVFVIKIFFVIILFTNLFLLHIIYMKGNDLSFLGLFLVNPANKKPKKNEK